MRARLLPNENAPPRPPPCIWRMKNIQTPIRSSIGNHEMKMFIRNDCSSSGFASTLTPSFRRSLTIHRSPSVPGLYVTYLRLSWATQRTVRPSTCAEVTRPCFTSSMNWEYAMTLCAAWRLLN